MPSRVRVGASRGGRAASDTPDGRDATYPGAVSAYGSSRADSVGYNPINPHAYTASQAAKAYPDTKNKQLFPPIKGTE